MSNANTEIAVVGSVANAKPLLTIGSYILRVQSQTIQSNNTNFEINNEIVAFFLYHNHAMLVWQKLAS